MLIDSYYESIDENACNYNENAETDNGSCEYANECGSCDGDLSCYGCTEIEACNYDQFQYQQVHLILYSKCGSLK